MAPVDRPLLYFAGWKHHVSVYPAPADLASGSPRCTLEQRAGGRA